MTEVSASATPSPLTVDAIYNHWGRTMIAVTPTEMVPLADTLGVKHVADERTELVGHPGSDYWVDIMKANRVSLAQDLANERAALQRVTTYVENLGEAILAKAEKHDWCSEYDEFADEWDLPKRVSQHEVTLTVIVEARDEESARDYVRENFSLSEYDEDVIQGPDFHVEKV